LRQRIGRRVDHEIDLAGDEILHGGAEAAAIRDEPEPCAGCSSKKQAAHGRYAAGPGRPLGRLIRVRLQPSDELLQVVGRHGLARDDQQWIARHQGNRFEIRQQIVAQREHGAVLATDRLVPM
jgi:hypothetical protein